MKVYDHITEPLIDWAREQKMFWVATAPSSDSGHINLSPKGVLGATFQIVNKNKVWYEDLTGSGVETLSHIRENGRITILFHAFVGGPRILRLHGKGVVYEFGTPEYERYLTPETRSPGSRSVIVVDVHRVTTSCGYGIPFYEYTGERTALTNFAVNREKKGTLQDYWKETNMKSIDGLPGIQTAHKIDMPPPVEPKLTSSITKQRNLRGISGGSRDIVVALTGFILGVLLAVTAMQFSLNGRRLIMQMP